VYYAYCDTSAVTDTGRRRSNNEDAVLSLPAFGVFCVADGMGGAEDGEVASRAVVKALQEGFAAFAEDDSACQSAAFKTSHITHWINQTSRWIFDRATSLGHQGSGSTVAMFFLDATNPKQACCLHAGDSRIYRFRVGALTQLTTDHSMAEEAGKNESDLPAMMRGVITRAVGVKPAVKLEKTVTDVSRGDVFILCSDGLTKMVSDKQISVLLASSLDQSTEKIATGLITAANAAGGVDNVSVVIVKVVRDLPPPIPSLEDEGATVVSATGETEEEVYDVRENTDTDSGLDPVTPTPITGESVLDGQAPKTPTDGWGEPDAARPNSIFLKKSIWGSIAAVLVLVAGPIFFFGTRTGKPVVERHQVESRVQIDCSSMARAGMPPVVLSYRPSGTPGAFRPIEGNVISLASGQYEIRAECPDYSPFTMPFIVEATGQVTSLTVPVLAPEPALKRLREAQQLVSKNDFQSLEKLLNRESLGIFMFAAHRAAWRDVESAFSKWKENSKNRDEKDFLSAKAEYEKQTGEINKVSGRPVVEIVEKYAPDIWKTAQVLASEASKMQADPLLGRKKYEDALTAVKRAMGVAETALKTPVRLTVACNIKNAEVWMLESGKWILMGAVNEALSLKPFIFQTLEVRAAGYEPEQITLAAAEPGENLGVKQVVPKTLLIRSSASVTVPGKIVTQSVPAPQESSASEKKQLRKNEEEFLSETEPFIRDMITHKLAVFQKNYLSEKGDALSSGTCWENVQKHDGNVQSDVVAARTGLYEAIYKRAVSITGEMALKNAIRNRPNPSLQNAWDVLKKGEVSATKDFYNWLANEGGYTAIENFVRLASEPRR